MKILLVCFALISVAFYQSSLGCTLMRKPLSKFDDSEYVFIGKVVGYTDAVSFDEKRAKNSVAPMSATIMGHSDKKEQETVGLIVKVAESIYLPKVSVEPFEIFPYDLMADCSIGGKPVEHLKRLFPIDSEIRVIAKEAEFVPKATSKGTIRLEVRPSEPNSIITNIDKKGLRMTSSLSAFSYKDYRYDMNSDSDSKYLLPAFEVRKDLLGLERAKTQLERNSILDRLFHAPSNSDLDMSGLFNSYAGSQAEADRYFESHLKATSPETYEQYEVIKQTLEELVRLGFERKSAKVAIGQAISEGTDFETAALIKKSAEILGAKKNQPKP